MTLMNDTPHEDEHGTEEEGERPARWVGEASSPPVWPARWPLPSDDPIASRPPRAAP